MTGDGNYISIAEISADFPLTDKISKASFPTTAISLVIKEAENAVEGKLIPLGYARADLSNAPVIKSLCFLYCRYGVIRDIFTNISPSESDVEAYQKWLDQFTAKVKDIVDPNSVNQLTDANGNIIPKINKDRRFIVESTTKEAKRIITTDNDTTWNIDDSNSSPEVVGNR